MVGCYKLSRTFVKHLSKEDSLISIWVDAFSILRFSDSYHYPLHEAKVGWLPGFVVTTFKVNLKLFPFFHLKHILWILKRTIINDTIKIYISRFSLQNTFCEYSKELSH